MLRIKDVPPEQMSEVVRVAGELYDRETAQEQERQSTVAAAAEMGLPPEYMERAAAVVHARQVERIHRRRRRTAFVAAFASLVTITGGYVLTRPHPAQPVTYNFQNPRQQWVQDVNPESTAHAGVEKGIATIHVDRFASSPGTGQFFANLNTEDVPQTLAGYRSVSFRVQGDGLTQLRLYLENGNERWRSVAVPVTGDWQVFHLNLDQFEHQTRDSGTGKWRREDRRAPGHVERLSFKAGYYVNDLNAHGNVRIADLRFY